MSDIGAVTQALVRTDHFTEMRRSSFDRTPEGNFPKRRAERYWAHLKDLNMETLDEDQVTEISGGISWGTPALIALADTGSLGPLVWSFAVGFAFGGMIARHYDL
jgi:hypothetical protein